MVKQTVIFDFDGTIADSFELVLSVYRQLTGDNKVYTPAEVEALRKSSVPQIMKAMHVPFHRLPRLLTRGRALMHQKVATVATFPGLKDAIASLHVNGYTLLVVSSNSADNVRLFLQKHGLEAYFTDVYGSIGLFSKSTKLKSIMKSHKMSRDFVCYVGDEVRDIAAARKAKIRIVSAAWGYQHIDALTKLNPALVAKNPSQMVSLIESSSV